MRRQPLYDIPGNAYLFREPQRERGALQTPEEKVRQWCAFELIREYGVRINELTFEFPVRLGSKTYRIDIFVRRDGKPWAVVECKRARTGKSELAVKQAISYAASPDVRAPFVVYTDGEIWHVRRRIGNDWFSVPDLPPRAVEYSDQPLTEVWRAIDKLAPVLFKLNETVAGDDARVFLEAMHGLFNAGTLLTTGVDPWLCRAADNLLRVLAAAEQHENYRLGKLSAAMEMLESYFERAGIAVALPSVDEREEVQRICRVLYASLLGTFKSSMDSVGLDILLLRLLAALAEYGARQEAREHPFPQVSLVIHEEIWNFIATAGAINLNIKLPDKLDHLLIGDLKEYCRPGWKQRVPSIWNLFR